MDLMEPKDLLDYLTPEERAAYSKKIAPTTGQRFGAFGSGVADAITSVGTRPTNFMQNYQSQMAQNMAKAEKDMYGTAEDRKKQLVDYLSQKKAEKNKESFTGLAGQYLPEFGDYQGDVETGKDMFKTIYTGQQGLKKAQLMANKPKSSKDHSYWWTAQRKGAMADPRVAPMLKSGVGLKEADALLKAVKSGNTLAFSGLGIKMAKGMGEVGVMTEADVNRYVQSRKFPQKITDMTLKFSQGVPSNATQKEINQILTVMSDMYQGEILPVYNEWINSAEAIAKGRGENITRDEVARRLALQGTVEAELQEPTSTLSSEEQAELERLERLEQSGMLGE